MNLFQISNEYQSILDDTFDEETGEIKEISLIDLNEVKEKLEDKIIAVASYIKNIDAEKEAVEQAKKTLITREARLNKRMNSLSEYLQSNMERCGISEIKSPYLVIKIKKCPLSVGIIDEYFIPELYKKHKDMITIDKLKIKEDILSGKEIPGALLKQNNRLEIK